MTRDSRRNRWSIPLVGRAVFVFTMTVVVLAGCSSSPAGRDEPAFAAKRGELRITVSEGGTIKAGEQVVIKSEVAGRTSIVWLVEEGRQVRAGDLLVELDASTLQDQLIDQQIRVQNSEAAFVRAREELVVVKNQAASDVEKATVDLRFARQDYEKYEKGEYPRKLKETEAQITLAEEEMRRAEERVKWSRTLFAEKFLSRMELQADELALAKARLDQELREADLELLKKYSHPRRLAELESNRKQAAMALERIKRKASADVIQAEADMQAKESALEREKAKLAKLQRQIEKTRITAPVDGLVIYATTAQGSWRGNAEPLAVGQEVREQQELIYLPRTGSMLAEIKLHESNLDRVKPGLPARVRVESARGRVFSGRVTSIAPLPDAALLWLNPDLKVYSTSIELEGDIGGLRTGMSCQAMIEVAVLEDVVYVPVQAVQRRGSEVVVYVRRPQGQGFVPRPVVPGPDDNSMVVITSGLAEGEQVLLNPPLAGGRRDAGAER